MIFKSLILLKLKRLMVSKKRCLIYSLELYKVEELKNYLTKNKIDSLNYNWAIEQVDSKCIKDIQMETFSISNNFLKIIDPCEFPDASKCMEPTYELKYT